jgi:hypothetical protein
MASKARKERRRLERERLQREVEQWLVNKVEAAYEAEQAGKEACSGGTLVEVVRHDQPAYTERAKKEFEQHGASYEEANWAKLSPAFRLAHNRLRQQRGMPPIPPPAVDLYKPPLVKHVDPIELERLAREAQTAKAQFLGQQRHMAPGREGFSINGEDLKF